MKQNIGYSKNADFYKAAFEKIQAGEEVKSNLRRADMGRAKKKHFSPVKMAGAAAAAICILFTGLVNSNAAFAASMEKVPVFGKLAEVVNFRSYSEETEDYAITVSIPSVVGDDSLSDGLNAEILKMCEQYASDAKKRAVEYRQAFLETGGTEEEWKEHDINISVDYEIKNKSSDYLSFVIYGYESWQSASAVAYYYNLDVHTMKCVTLEEFLGEDYADIANKQIRQQIKEREKHGDEVFFSEEEGGFQSVSEDQNYYINDAGNAVVVFDKYAVALGFMGEVEFEITAD